MLPPQMRNADATMPGSGNPSARQPDRRPRTIRTRIARRSSPSLDLQSDLREVYDAANRNNVAIYAVDPRGLPGFEFDINENIGIADRSRST